MTIFIAIVEPRSPKIAVLLDFLTVLQDNYLDTPALATELVVMTTERERVVMATELVVMATEPVAMARECVVMVTVDEG